MKRKYFLFFIFLHMSLFSNAHSFHIVIDPGHGGNDVGAVKNNIKESDLVLNIAKKIENIFHSKDQTIKVELTRSQNRYLSLDERIKNKSPDLFLSLHANSSISSKVSGMEVYFQPEQKIKSETIKDAIIEDLKSIGKTDQSHLFSQKLKSQWNLSPSILRRSGFYVVEKTDSPSVLVEIGFLTNPVEAEKLKTDVYQTQIAETIVNAVLDYQKSIQ